MYSPRMRTILVNAAFLLFFLHGAAHAAALPRIAVFDFELIDNSLDGQIYGTSNAERSAC